MPVNWMNFGAAKKFSGFKLNDRKFLIFFLNSLRFGGIMLSFI